MRTEPTWTEAKLWKSLRTLKAHFRRQVPIGPYVADFACHSARLVVEIDGGVHQLPEVALRDMERDGWLASQGYRVLRFEVRQIEHDLDSVLAAIQSSLASPSNRSH